MASAQANERAPAAGSSPLRDERTLLKISLLDNAGSSYEICLLNKEGLKEFHTEMAEEQPAYYQLCLFQDRNPKNARQIHIRKNGSGHEGTVEGTCLFDEETLRKETSVTLQPAPEMDQHGEEIPGKGEPVSVRIELRAVAVY